MNIYLWRHNKTYHSHSMIDEPCLNNEFYLDALAIVVAHDLEEALAKLAEQNAGWRIDYFLVSNRVAQSITSTPIYSEVTGSDHCPVGLEIGF